MRDRRTLFLALLLAVAPIYTVNAENVLPQDGPGITLLTLRGDEETLSALAKSEGVAKYPAAAAWARVDSDLKKSDAWVSRCIGDAAVKSQKGQGAMYLCKSLGSGNFLANGNIDAWARGMLEVRKIYEAEVKPSLKPGDETEPLTKPDFQAFVGRPISGALLQPLAKEEQIEIDMTHGIPLIKGVLSAEIEGKMRSGDSDFILDTGSTRSIISQEFAQAMGLKITPRFFSEALNPSNIVEFGLTDPVDLRIGGATFKNVSFSTSKNVKVNVIGLDLLRQLGAVRISKEWLTLLPTSAPSCKTKFRYSSMLWGTPMAARMPATIRGKKELVHLDTGSSVALEASGVGLAGFPEKDLKQKEVVDVFGKKTLRYAESSVSLVIDNQAMNIDAIVTDQPAMVFPVSWRLGAGILNEKSIYFDAAKGFACLERNQRINQRRLSAPVIIAN